MTPVVPRLALVPVLALFAAACGREFEGGGDLRAQKVVLKREVDGIREIVTRLERGEPVLPLDDVAISIDDTFVRDLVAAQLPFEMDVDRFHLSLTEAEAQFRGSPVVRLRGALRLKERPDLEAAVTVVGALEEIQVEQSTSTLRAKIAVDHIGIEKAAGLEQVLSGSTMDEAARLVRLQIEGQLPPIQIPVKVQQSIDLPAVTNGPVRIDGARMPLQVAVSQVTAGQGRILIGVHFQPGDFVKTGDAPPVGDANASDAGVSLGVDEEPVPDKAGPRARGRRSDDARPDRRSATLAAVALVAAVVASTTCRRKDRQVPEELRAEIAALEKERDTLRARMNELMVKDPRLEGMPGAPVRVGVPTTLARDLIQRDWWPASWTRSPSSSRTSRSRRAGRSRRSSPSASTTSRSRSTRNRQAEDRQAGRDVRGQQGLDRPPRARGLGHR